MLVSDKNILAEFCENFCKVIEKHCTYAVVSGFFIISSGRSRGTEDIDLIIERLSRDKFIKLHDSLINAGFNCLQSSDANEVYDYLINNSSIRYISGSDLIPQMEVKFARDKLDEYQLSKRRKEPFTGVDVYFSSIECNIAFKEELLKSSKDLSDAKFLRTVYKEKINEPEVDKIKGLIRSFRLK